jgi:hypothetical protein
MRSIRSFLALVAMLATAGAALAGSYSDTIALFKNAGASASFFGSSYGYAVFPTIGKGGLVVGGAHGSGHVYEKGKYIGNTSMTQVSVGFQAGGQAYSQIIFSRDYGGGLRLGRHRWRQCRRQRWQERRHHIGPLLQGNGDFHDRQGRGHVRGIGSRSEVLV